MTAPVGLLNVLAAKADRVLAARALALLPATVAPHVRDEDRRRMITSLEGRAGRHRTRRADVERTVAALGLEWHGSR